MKKIKYWILSLDFISIIFGLGGIICGILSVLALNSFWSPDKHIRESDSFMFSIATVSLDVVSVIAALAAFLIGRAVYIKEKKAGHVLDPRIEKLEQKTIVADLISFILGLIGLIFGIMSIVWLLPTFLNEKLSYDITIASVVFDFLSSLSVGVAIYFFVNIKKINVAEH
ncbi:hypothetical protein ESOMN_v1c06350 [Williamsoniiplasma somnilux]|uniref:Uncharacterized protein n=1 Tax=Williamsoniiplasma somnilux TaxID=215578 RepID=A0A2K8NZ01_9MOLU|nr:hypothetical protein [Williamsoniiplasma somnilux]ATZ19017.1 hypothetical protein ESOMN_v1c06350 [Williamsoniiplasma somnilux]